MRKGLIFVVLVSLLLLVACEPKEEVKAPVTVEYEEIEAVDGESLAEVDDFDVGDLDELDTLDEELKEIEKLEI